MSPTLSGEACTYVDARKRERVIAKETRTVHGSLFALGRAAQDIT